MKFLIQPLICFALLIPGFTAIAGTINIGNVHVNNGVNGKELYFNKEQVQRLSNNHRLGYSFYALPSEPISSMTQFTGSHYSKDIFLLRDKDGFDLIFENLPAAEQFRTQLIDTIVDKDNKKVSEEQKQNIQFYGYLGFTKKVVAVGYKDVNRKTNFLTLPNKWSDDGNNALIPVSGEQVYAQNPDSGVLHKFIYGAVSRLCDQELQQVYCTASRDAPRVDISGRKLNNDTFLIQDANGLDLFFDNFDAANSFKKQFIDTIVDMNFQPITDQSKIHVYAQLGTVKTEVALVYKDTNGEIQYLVFPSEWNTNIQSLASPF